MISRPNELLSRSDEIISRPNDLYISFGQVNKLFGRHNNSCKRLIKLSEQLINLSEQFNNSFEQLINSSEQLINTSEQLIKSSKRLIKKFTCSFPGSVYVGIFMRSPQGDPKCLHFYNFFEHVSLTVAHRHVVGSIVRRSCRGHRTIFMIIWGLKIIQRSYGDCKDSVRNRRDSSQTSHGLRTISTESLWKHYDFRTISVRF